MNIIKLFERVRDIPYSIPLEYGEEDKCCSGKSEKIFNLLKNEGYKVRYRVCVFLWDDLPLPNKVKNILHDADCTHTYIECYINKKWIIVDAT